jgi:hypothetical protein
VPTIRACCSFAQDIIDANTTALRDLAAFAGVNIDGNRVQCAYHQAEVYHRKTELSIESVFCNRSRVSAEVLAVLAKTFEPAGALGYAPLICPRGYVE